MGEGFELDCDDLTDMIDDISRYFNINDPVINDWDKYQLSLIAFYGVSLWDLFCFWLARFLKRKRQAHINYEGMTIARLCEIIEAGQWPREYLLPPGYMDTPPDQ